MNEGHDKAAAPSVYRHSVGPRQGEANRALRHCCLHLQELVYTVKWCD